MTEPNPSPDDAFQRAAEELWMPVYRFALAMTNDLSEADDVAQEACIRLWDRRATNVVPAPVRNRRPRSRSSSAAGSPRNRQ